jgi:hypothetical protein
MFSKVLTQEVRTGNCGLLVVTVQLLTTTTFAIAQKTRILFKTTIPGRPQRLPVEQNS